VITTDVKDLDIDGQNNAQAHPVRFVGILYRNVDGEISGNTIHDMYDADSKGDGPETFGILVYGDSNVEILNNHISEFSRGGIGVSGDVVGWAWGPAPDPVALVQGNTVIGNGFEPETGWWAENGIQLGYGATGQIVENVVTDCWSNSAWSSTGILVVGTEGVEVLRNLVDNNETGIAVMGLTAWGGNPSADNLIQGNDVTNGDWGISLQYDANTTTILENVISGNYSGIDAFAYIPGAVEPVGTEVHYNSIAGNTYGFINWDVLADIDATLNWWGAANGPSADLDQDGAWDYVGGGDAIWGMVIFSPWLGIDPDGDPTTPGVQLVSPILFIVDDIGPAPAGGYLGTAIGAANDLAGSDTIEVRSGTYAEDATITNPVTIESQEGCPSTTFIDGNLVLGREGIQLGSLRHGFTIRGDLTVGAGINAAQIHVNWNNIEGQVTNTDGIGSLDATYNFWGADGPLDNIVGQVHYYPYLPVEVCMVIQYMDDYGLNPNQAIVMARKVLKHVNPKDILAAFGLVNMCGMSMDNALALIREYGRVKVQRALRLAHGDCAKLYTQLVGYGVGGGGWWRSPR
jgi:parallel beta-helix repeat protein